MDKLLILSGKGGTGKTTVAAAFIDISKAEAFADCDVDAPNLHLVTKADGETERSDYFGLPRGDVDESLCIGCGKCAESCRFGAVSLLDGKASIDPYSCEGCKVCTLSCPVGAIAMKPFAIGELSLSKGTTTFSAARLKTGGGATGKLVSEVKRRLFLNSVGAKTAIIDGSPGIGCPVLASMNGASLVLIVAEPSLSGISDMSRVIKTAQKQSIPVCVCVNKWDTNPQRTLEIEEFCAQNQVPFTGKIPFDLEAVKAVNSAIPLSQTASPSGIALRDVYIKTMNVMKEKRTIK